MNAKRGLCFRPRVVVLRGGVFPAPPWWCCCFFASVDWRGNRSVVHFLCTVLLTACAHGRTGGRTDGRTDGCRIYIDWLYRRMADGRTDGGLSYMYIDWLYRRMADGRTDGCRTYIGWLYRRMADGRTDERTDVVLYLMRTYLNLLCGRVQMNNPPPPAR